MNYLRCCQPGMIGAGTPLQNGPERPSLSRRRYRLSLTGRLAGTAFVRSREGISGHSDSVDADFQGFEVILPRFRRRFLSRQRSTLVDRISNEKR